ncbi:murein transglycosylase A [Benzoatithermus flavus]|uniref:peptidoglycan lytic exotransglycosylase n=1 Tax=Benzoatithermus flavus TaxID=3108223 RepID=A0ABU8XQM0_9PROT
MIGRLPLSARLVVALAVLLALAVACTERKKGPPALELEPVSFTALPGWEDDDPREALQAFRASCGQFARQAPETRLGGAGGFAGSVADWLPACVAADAAARVGTPEAARAFFAAEFVPFRVTDRGDPEGLFTGYYEPLLSGSRTPDARFRYPLLKRPADLVTVDLGAFDPELAGRRIAGRVEKGRLVPYPDRAKIESGALAGRDLELLWVDDPIARFFLEIQGSGQIRLTDGETVRVGYADQNGHPYRAIGKDLLEMEAIPKERMSMQAIREWLEAHPDQAPEVMAKNRSYVFFRELPDLAHASGPLGAQGVPLVPGRSLAVDRKFLPLGAPLWLDATAPYPDGNRPLRRLVVAQDTGGAIRGPVRGDLFWGAGPLAEHLAGHMQSQGRLFILLPRRLAPTS